MAGPIRVAEPAADDVAAVRELSPLVADLTFRGGPFAVPVGVLAMSATLEQEDSEEAAIARDFIRADPWRGMGSVTPGGWMLLARDDDTVVIGQREHTVGLGRVVVLTREDDGFRARSMGGWRPESAVPGLEIEVSFPARVDGATVSASWMNGQDLRGVPDRLFSHAEVLEQPDAVHVLLHSRANPVASRSGWSVGTGLGDRAVFELAAPLGDCSLWCDQRVPPIGVEVTTGA